MRRFALAGALALLAGVHPPCAVAARPFQAGGLERDLRTDRPIVLYRAHVVGGIHLEHAAVRSVFECHECTFEGGVAAPDTTFDSTVDLSGSRFEKGVDFRGATFNKPALFRAIDPNEADVRSPPKSGRAKAIPARFERRADFSLAVFNDISSFGSSRFDHTAAFADTRFSDATFTNTDFARAIFDRASFRGAALFNDATFAGHAWFEQAQFRQNADFSSGTFSQGADFLHAQFDADVSFLGTHFFATKRFDDAVTFQFATAAGDLNFTFADFELRGGTSLRAVFSHLVSSASLVLRELEPPDSLSIAMSKVQVRDLAMDVDLVRRLDDADDQRGVLAAIESSAKARGDLGEANRAHYARQVLKSETHSFVVHGLDYVFYRGVAGYFVRPDRPLLALLILIGLVSVVRMYSRWRKRKPAPDDWKRLRRARRRCGNVLMCILDTLANVALRRPGGATGPPPLAVRLESFAYRLLLVCVLLGLANSNPTLRQMFDTLL
jgi:uncharacterized protein YjbI with pentapeptide repeats